jgi:hypothetical protein
VVDSLCKGQENVEGKGKDAIDPPADQHSHTTSFFPSSTDYTNTLVHRSAPVPKRRLFLPGLAY